MGQTQHSRNQSHSQSKQRSIPSNNPLDISAFLKPPLFGLGLSIVIWRGSRREKISFMASGLKMLAQGWWAVCGAPDGQCGTAPLGRVPWVAPSSTGLGTVLNLARLFPLWKEELLRAAGESASNGIHQALNRFLPQAQVGPYCCLAIFSRNNRGI